MKGDVAELGTQWLIFVIDAGEIKWRSAHDTREDAIEHLNWLRPDGSMSEAEDETPVAETFKVDDCIEFAFIVPSPHFVSFV